MKIFNYHAFLLLVLCLPVFGVMAQDDKPVHAYKVGVVPQFDSRQIHATWQPILSELENRTGVKFILSGSPSIPQFEKEYLNGKFDFAYTNPFLMLKGHEHQGYNPLVRDHAQQLCGVLTVRADSPITSVEQLNGKTIAFPSANALGASLLIRADLQDRLKIKFTPKYVKNHSSVYLNVALGHAVAGGGVQKTLEKQPLKVQNRLRILHETHRVAAHPISVHPRVSRDLKEQVLKQLLAMGQIKQGQKMLAQIPIKQIGPASMANYDDLLKLGLERFYQESR